MDEIERLELRIEELRGAIARSRKLALAGRAAAILGATMIACFLIGLLDFTPARAVAAIALAIGGVVLMGSSRSSTEAFERALNRAEAERNAAIDGREFFDLGEWSA